MNGLTPDQSGQISALEARVAELRSEVDKLPKKDLTPDLGAVRSIAQGASRDADTANSFIRALHGANGVIVNGNTIQLDQSIFAKQEGAGGDGTGGLTQIITGCLNGIPAYTIALCTQTATPL